MKMQPVTHKKAQLGMSVAAKQKKEKREKWGYLKERARVYAFCLVGVLGHRALDVAGETINFRSLSLDYAAFAVLMAVLLTLWLERREIPANMPRKKATGILRRMAFNAGILGFTFQEAVTEITGKLSM